MNPLEPRQLLAAVTGTTGNDVIVVEVVSPKIVITVNGTPQFFDDAVESQITVDGSDGADLIILKSNGDNSVTFTGGNGNDTLQAGDGNMDGINTSATVGIFFDPVGNNRGQFVEFDDTLADPAIQTNYTVFTESFRRIKNGMQSNITFVNEGHVEVEGSEGPNLFRFNDNVDTVSSAIRTTLVGNGGNDTFTVVSIDDPASIPVIRGGAGDDVINIAPVAGATAIAIIDQSDALSSITVAPQGTLVISNGTSTVLTTRQLAVASGGKLDLNDNTIIIDYTGASPAVSVGDLLALGRNGGTWNASSGIVSSTVAGIAGSTLGYAEASNLFNNFPATFAGESIDNTALLIRFTYGGDANLDRTVNARDLGILSGNWQGTSKTFSQGDFNYDGKVDINDLYILASKYQQTLPPPPLAAISAIIQTPARRAPVRMANLVI